jgi:hypothetical protein
MQRRQRLTVFAGGRKSTGLDGTPTVGPTTLSLLPLLRPTIFLLAPVLEQILVECFETVSEAQDLKSVAITDGPDF